MNTQTAYAKVEAETPVAKDSAAYDKQRDRKKNAAKASEANATLAGFIRLAVLDDPSAQQTVMGAIGMAGKDGVLALQALWASYGPEGCRCACTNRSTCIFSCRGPHRLAW